MAPVFHMFIKHIAKEKITYCDSFGSLREPSSDCDFDCMTSQDLNYHQTGFEW